MSLIYTTTIIDFLDSQSVIVRHVADFFPCYQLAHKYSVSVHGGGIVESLLSDNLEPFEIWEEGR